MLVHWIWLATRPGLTDRAKRAILQHFQDPEDAYYADPVAYQQVEGCESIEPLQDKALQDAETILVQCMDQDIRILTIQDAAYPDRLRNIADPPLVLYYKGRLPDCDARPVIAVVGTRSATGYGLTVAKRMGYQIARCGGVVVSGMAYGIDGVAMRGALTADGTVIGVLGCGADVVYPPSNRSLFTDVIHYGCLLTEFPPATPPARWNFPKRNRIMSGLSCGVLVVEAPEKSGALITARQAADQGRDVFVVPGNIDVPTCAGSNALLREGAIAVGSGWDILSEYASLYPGKVHRFDRAAEQTAYPEEVVQAEPPRRLCKVAQKPKAVQPSRPSVPTKPIPTPKDESPVLNEQERAILQYLRNGPCLLDDLIAQCTLPASTVLATLTVLEIRGIVTRHAGNRISWNAHTETE